ncbi:MAG: hypothetical protein K6U74_02275 [Firmicutes bacterium]|nr:hypothetical protein [Bacillota bacterium]
MWTKWFYADDLVELRERLNEWLVREKPQIVAKQRVVDGTLWTYVYVVWYC